MIRVVVVVCLFVLGEKREVRCEERWRWVWSFACEMYGCVDVRRMHDFTSTISVQKFPLFGGFALPARISMTCRPNKTQ